MLAQAADVSGVDRIRQRAAIQSRGDQNLFSGIHDLGGFTHEPHRGKDDQIRGGFHRVLAQGVGIAHIIGHAINDLRADVRVDENNGVKLFLELIDLVDDRNQLGALLEGIMADRAPDLDVLQGLVELFGTYLVLFG